MNIYKEEVETVEGYLSLVLQELQAYSHSVSQFFNVKEIYGKVYIKPEQCCCLCLFNDKNCYNSVIFGYRTQRIFANFIPLLNLVS